MPPTSDAVKELSLDNAVLLTFYKAAMQYHYPGILGSDTEYHLVMLRKDNGVNQLTASHLDSYGYIKAYRASLDAFIGWKLFNTIEDASDFVRRLKPLPPTHDTR